ncbi:alpha/beta hydrolase [Aurantivibrio plasticivorans]
MQNITWNGTRLRVQSYNVQVGAHQLELRRCFRQASGVPIFMVPGFLESTQLFLPSKGLGGLAPYLANQGFDVYLAELRGKGASWPSASRAMTSGVHEAICEDIPAHLGMLEKLRPGEPQFWLGQGLGSLLLLGSYARIAQLMAPVAGMIHISPGRHCSLHGWRKALSYQAWSSLLKLQSLVLGYCKSPFSDPVKAETKATLDAIQKWHTAAEWLDPVDGFDYRQGLRDKLLPPSLYVANRKNALWGNVDDCRLLINELGEHDGRMIVISKQGGNLRDYTSTAMLKHPKSCIDHFEQIHTWVEERLVSSNSQSTHRELEQV